MQESYCDVTLACDGKFYSLHKFVLSTCSEYFEQMFDKTQCKHPVIVLKDINSEDLEALLSYMYVGEVNVVQEKLTSLIKAAECLRIKGLAVPDEDPVDNNKPPRETPKRHSSTSRPHESPKTKRMKRSHESNFESERSRFNHSNGDKQVNYKSPTQEVIPNNLENEESENSKINIIRQKNNSSLPVSQISQKEEFKIDEVTICPCLLHIMTFFILKMDIFNVDFKYI